MFTEKEILARLQNGESMDTIANEISSLLNSAKDAYEAEEAAKKAAAESAKRVEECKVQEMEDIIELVADWAHTYYDVDPEIFDLITAEDVIKIIEECKAYVDAMEKLAASLGTKIEKAPAKAALKKDPAREIEQFLKSMGW